MYCVVLCWSKILNGIYIHTRTRTTNKYDFKITSPRPNSFLWQAKYIRKSDSLRAIRISSQWTKCSNRRKCCFSSTRLTEIIGMETWGRRIPQSTPTKKTGKYFFSGWNDLPTEVTSAESLSSVYIPSAAETPSFFKNKIILRLFPRR